MGGGSVDRTWQMHPSTMGCGGSVWTISYTSFMAQHHAFLLDGGRCRCRHSTCTTGGATLDVGCYPWHGTSGVVPLCPWVSLEATHTYGSAPCFVVCCKGRVSGRTPPCILPCDPTCSDRQGNGIPLSLVRSLRSHRNTFLYTRWPMQVRATKTTQARSRTPP